MIEMTEEQERAILRKLQDAESPPNVWPNRHGEEYPPWKAVRFKNIRVENYMVIECFKWVKMELDEYKEHAWPYFDTSGCIMIPWYSMQIGIEKDGYAHS